MQMAWMFLIIAGLSPFLSTSFAQASSSLCKANGISSLNFNGVNAIQIKGDVCKLQASTLPAPITTLIRDMGRIHLAIAKTIGQTLPETIGDGFSISFEGSEVGTIESYALRDGSGITMKVFPDWNLKTWSSQTYAHELIHVLSYRKGAFAQAVIGLEDHPFISEALPDLISIDVHNDPIVKFEDDLPACLINRDASPTQSLSGRFGDYYTFAASDRLQTCCDSLRPSQKNTHASAICQKIKDSSSEGFYTGMRALGATLQAPTQSDLSRPFRFIQCAFQIKGFDLLDGCGTHSFALPLSSFFMAWRSELGHSLVADWIRILKKQSKQVTQNRCGYQNKTAPKKSISFVLRGVSPSLKALREGLTANEKIIFDRIWNAHDFDQLAELDSLWMSRLPRTLALGPLSAVNSPYANEHRCSSVYAIDATACAVECH